MVIVATYKPDRLFLDKASAFNAVRGDYERLEVVDYALFDELHGYGNAILSLRSDMSEGRFPDMFYWSLQAGLNGVDPSLFHLRDSFVDINELLLRDASVNRDSFIPSVIDSVASELGGLYELPVEFIIHAVACDQSVISTDRWDMDSFQSVHTALGSPLSAFGKSSGKALLLIAYLQNNFREYINFEYGKCCFASHDFIRFLEFTKTQDIDYKHQLLPNEAISDGSQILFYEAISDVSSLQKFKAVLNSEVNFIGFPVKNGRGNSCFITRGVSIVKDSPYTDLCWSFIREYCTEGFQYDNVTYFPSNMSALSRRLDRPDLHEESGYTLAYQASDGRQLEIQFREPTRSESDQIKDLILSLDRVHRPSVEMIQLIYSCTESFYSGAKDATETAEAIERLVTNWLDNRIVLRR